MPPQGAPCKQPYLPRLTDLLRGNSAITPGPEICLHGRQVGINLGQLCTIRYVVLTPSFPPEDIVSNLKLLVLRLYHLPHAATIERLTHLKWLDIAGLVEHTAAHIRINGHIEVAHQYLAGTRCGDRDSREFKVALAW